MLLCDISNIGKNHWKGDSKDSRHGNDSKIPPETEVTKGRIRNQPHGRGWITTPSIFFLQSILFHCIIKHSATLSCRLVAYEVLWLIFPLCYGLCFTRWSNKAFLPETEPSGRTGRINQSLGWERYMPRLLLYWTDTSISSPNAIPANPSLLSFTLALLLRNTQNKNKLTTDWSS